MRVLLINTSERIGGAAIAASRLMEALKNNGIKAKMLVRDKQTDEITVVALDKSWKNMWRFVWERIVIWKANHFKRQNLFAVDIANTGCDVTSLPEFKQADVIHLHWINQGMLSLKNIQKIINSGKPIIWTMHDMWPCTAICHHARTCTYFHEHCHNCFYLNGDKNKDLSFRIFEKKKQLYKNTPITFVTCSQWLGNEARKSALIRGKQILTIANPINTNLFRPRGKQEARRSCDLPDDKKFILFGSVKTSNKRKGFDYLLESCKIIIQQYPEFSKSLAIVLVGEDSESIQNQMPLPVYALGYVDNEHKMTDVYNAVDLYVTPSLEDNLPNTIAEAMSCGIPCVGFNVGGIPEMIDHLHNGYVAEYKSAADFANGIHWCLTEGNYKELSEQAVRKAISSYSEGSVAMKYIELYNKVTNKHA